MLDWVLSVLVAVVALVWGAIWTHVKYWWIHVSIGCCLAVLIFWQQQRHDAEIKELEGNVISRIVENQNQGFGELENLIQQLQRKESEEGSNLELRIQLLASEILLFVESMWPVPEPRAGFSESQRAKVNQLMENYLLSEYQKRFVPEVIRIKDELASRGISDGVLNTVYKDPFNVTGIKVVGERLDALADKVQE